MIWIIGSRGMLGTELCRLLENKGFDITATDREIDFTDIKALEEYADGLKEKIDWIINCAAYTAVDKAEEQQELCYSLNSKGPENIAKCAEKYNAKLIHISTDYVFDGKSPVPYKEDDKVNPLSVYGKSKLEGEVAIQKLANKYFILRTAWLYGEFGNNFVYTMIKLMKSKDEIRVVADQYGAPTWTRDLSECISLLIESKSTSYGIYHTGGSGKCSWHDFAHAIQNEAFKRGMLDKKIPVKKLTTEEYPSKAVRPKFSLLNKEKIRKETGFIFPQWEDSLKLFIEEISRGKNENI